MAITFEDRKSAYPNRYKVTPLTGSSYFVYLERADEPIKAGTPLNAETFNAMAEQLSRTVQEYFEQTLFEKTEMAFHEDPNNSAYTYEVSGGEVFDLVLGRTYYITWDGAEYECVAGSRTIGTQEYVVVGDLASYPFVIATRSTSRIIMTQQTGDHSVKIFEIGATGLPMVTATDDTKTLVVENGEWVVKRLSLADLGAVARIGEVALLSSKWITEDDHLYSQVVTVTGATENTQVDLTPSVEQLAIFYEKDLTFVTENEDGVVTVYAIGQKPQDDYTIQVTLTEVL